ncbi:hypothetical protein [Gordonia sp. CPCC 206044]|uniref:hypothetical protein n=1 Tax=Gordonia sp. CPCC 206044 TaxID=3140793 RepID=UPI003AF3AB5A
MAAGASTPPQSPPAPPDNATRLPGIELVKTGVWEISTGIWTVTPADLRSAVDAHRAGVLRKPVIKLGHVDPRFDGDPAYGFVDNLALADAGHTLRGDLILPGWLADAAPMSYPDRSVEALIDYTDGDGRAWPLILSAVALLGATPPGIDDLTSLQHTVTAASSGQVIVLASHVPDPHRRVRVIAAARRQRGRKKV